MATGTPEDIEEMKARVQEMEAEAEKLREMQAQAQTDGAPTASASDADARSIYIGNVDYSSTPEEVQEHFQSCGTINRVTIVCDKWSGHPKGFGPTPPRSNPNLLHLTQVCVCRVCRSFSRPERLAA